MESSIKAQAVNGAIWSFADKIGTQALSFLSFLILTRLLAPEDFGIVSLAGAIVAIPALFLNEGFGTALVQREAISGDHINAAFWANLLLAICIVGLLQLTASMIGQLTGKPTASTLIHWLSLSCVATALNSIAATFYVRQFRFSKLAQRSFISIATGATIALVMATAGFGVWSLVGYQLASALAASVVLWWGVTWRPRLSISKHALEDLLHFGLTTTFGAFFRFASERVDVIVIGYFLDGTTLGYYYLMGRLISMLEIAIFQPLDGVMFLLLSRAQSNELAFRAYYIQMLWASTAVWLPAAFGLGAIASNLLPKAFGVDWAGAVPMLTAASLIGLSGAFLRATIHVVLALGRPRFYVTINLLKFFVTPIVMVCVTQIGSTALGLGYALISFIMLPVHFFVVRQLTGIQVVELLRAFFPIVVSGGIMASVVCFVGTWGTGLWMVFVQVAFGIIVYSILLFLISREQVKVLLFALKSSSIIQQFTSYFPRLRATNA